MNYRTIYIIPVMCTELRGKPPQQHASTICRVGTYAVEYDIV